MIFYLDEKKIEEIQQKLGINSDHTRDYVKEVLQLLDKTYKTRIKSFYEPKATPIVTILPGLKAKPIKLIDVYEEEDHYAFVSIFYGLATGRELSFKINKDSNVSFEHCKEILENVALEISSRKIVLDMWYGIAVHYLKEDLQTDQMKAIIIVNDPILQDEDSDRIEYKLIFAINQEVYDAIYKDGSILLDPWADFIDSEFEKNPKMISKI